MFRRLTVWILLAAPCTMMAASKEMQELQRDVAQLQDLVRQVQRSQDEKFAALQVLVQQAVDASNRANTAVAVIQSSLQQNLKDQEGKVVAPVVGLSSRMDQVSNDMRTMQQAVADMTSVLTKMQTQLTDVGNAVKVMQAPVPAPPGASSGAGSASASPAASGDVPTIPAKDLYDNAMRDKTGGKFDLALEGFTNYLKWYGNTDLAPNAQYQLGSIYYQALDYKAAASAFDLVLERYPANNKTADARLMKGRSLLRLPGRKTDAADEFKELVKDHPGSEQAKQACTELNALGYSSCKFSGSSKTPARKRR
jgi:tol-pal system protein YbgF